MGDEYLERTLTMHQKEIIDRMRCAVLMNSYDGFYCWDSIYKSCNEQREKLKISLDNRLEEIVNTLRLQVKRWQLPV
jgi:hypothetical protein